MSGHRWGEWMAALAGALALHLAALLLWQPAHRSVAATGHPTPWRMQLRLREAPAVLAQPAPRQAVSPPQRPVQRPAESPLPEARAPVIPAPASPPPDEDSATAPMPRTPLWIDANQADQAPAPEGNAWRLADMPWPEAYPAVEVQLWITADGRIERFELVGEAADDPALRQLFAPFADTPMQPAYLRSVPVPSTMRIQLWPGDGPVPDFVAPLPPTAR